MLPEIFKAYDIRGVVGKSLTEATVELIGKSLGTEAVKRGGKTIAIGRDGRLSGPAFAAAWRAASNRPASTSSTAAWW